MSDGEPDIRTTPIKWVLQRAYCQVCGKEFRCTGNGVTHLHTTWEHKCGCEKTRWLRMTYPCTAYEEIP